MSSPKRKNYGLLVGGGMMVLGAVAALVTLLYTPSGPSFLFGAERSAAVETWAIVNLAGGLAAIGGGVALLLARLRWARVILFVLSLLGLALFASAHLGVGLVFVIRQFQGGTTGTAWYVPFLYMVPHLAVAGGFAYLAVQVGQALFDGDSPYRIEPRELLSAFAAIAVVVVALGGGFYMENARWVTATRPSNQQGDVPLYQPIVVHTALPASGASISYAGSPEPIRAAILRGENFVLVQPTVLEPGRQVVVQAESAWRTFRFTFYTQKEAAGVTNFYLAAIHDFYSSVNGPWAPGFVGLETAGMAGLSADQQVLVARTLLAYSYSPYIHSERLANSFVKLSEVDPLYKEFDLEGAPRLVGRVATARAGIVIAPILKDYRPGLAELEIHFFMGPEVDSAFEHVAAARYRGELRQGTWVLTRVQ